jgi:hypothetical protein
MKDKEPQQLTVGSTYQINSLGSKDAPIVTSGIFKGYSIVGNVEALCIELDKSHKKMKGKLRMIPSHMILSVDIIKEVEEKEKDDEEAMAKSYL